MPDSHPAEHLDQAIDAALARSVTMRPLGFFFDLDGVLAPIQDEPDDARPLAGIIDQLARWIIGTNANSAGNGQFAGLLGIAVATAFTAGFAIESIMGTHAGRYART